MSVAPSISASVQEPELAARGQGVGSMSIHQPGLSGLWGLVTAKDSLNYWLKGKAFSTFILTRWAFALYFVCVALNGFVAIIRIIYAGNSNELAIYPATTAFLLLFILATTKERSQGLYFWAAWSFWIFYNLIALVNATSLTADSIYYALPGVVKSWINLIGVPWMAFRIISPDKLPRYTKILVFTTAIGSVMCLIQIASPELFSYIRDVDSLRGAATWGNANNAGLVLMLALLLCRLVDWRHRWLKWTVFLILLAGFVGTFSRGAMTGYVFGEITYLLIIRNYKRMFIAGTFLLLFLAAWLTVGLLVYNNTIVVKSKEIRERVQTVSNLFTGNVGEDLEKGRFYLWRAGVMDVLTKGSVLFGFGHNGMSVTSLKMAPHNEYIHYFGEGGLVGLTAFLSLLAALGSIFSKCKDRNIRAVLMSMFIGYLFFLLSCDKVLTFQMFGPFLAIMILWAHYSRGYPGEEKIKRLKRALFRSVALANTTPAVPG